VWFLGREDRRDRRDRKDRRDRRDRKDREDRKLKKIRCHDEGALSQNLTLFQAESVLQISRNDGRLVFLNPYSPESDEAWSTAETLVIY
jgi:hypothetical protein